MIFVTVGSQQFPFDRLLSAVDECISKGAVSEEVFAQTGACKYVPKKYLYTPFLDHADFEARVREADIVLTHGGTGAIVGALKKGKHVVAMPRLARFGEHVDDHQVQLVEEFEQAGLIESCIDADSLGEAIRRVKAKPVPRYTSNTSRFIDDLDRYLSGTEPKE